MKRFIVYAVSRQERDGCQNIIVPLDEVIINIIGVLGEWYCGGAFNLLCFDLVGDGVLRGAHLQRHVLL